MSVHVLQLYDTIASLVCVSNVCGCQSVRFFARGKEASWAFVLLWMLAYWSQH